MKSEDRSQEETQKQERCALTRKVYKLEEKDKATFSSPTDKLDHASRIHHETGGESWW